MVVYYRRFVTDRLSLNVGT